MRRVPGLTAVALAPGSFWDWEKGEKLDYFHNGNPRYTRVTAMEYLNGQDCSLLLTATGERVQAGPPGGLGGSRAVQLPWTLAVRWQRGHPQSQQRPLSSGVGRLLRERASLTDSGGAVSGAGRAQEGCPPRTRSSLPRKGAGASVHAAPASRGEGRPHGPSSDSPHQRRVPPSPIWSEMLHFGLTLEPWFAH